MGAHTKHYNNNDKKITHNLDHLWFQVLCDSKIKFSGQVDKMTGRGVLKTIKSD